MTEIPNAFGGFAPFPNTIMIPTMGLQSDVIGFRFGFGYEKGKRTLRAMSNEQFNDLTEEAESAIYKRHDTTAINFFQLEIQNWTDLQKIIIEKSVEIEKMKAERTPSAFREMFQSFTKGFSEQQEQDAKDFFSSLADPIMKLMAWFNGARNQQPVQPTPSPTSRRTPTSSPTSSPSSTSTPISLKASQENIDKGAILQQNKVVETLSANRQIVLDRIKSANSRTAQALQQQAGRMGGPIDTAVKKLLQMRNTFKLKYGYWA